MEYFNFRVIEFYSGIGGMHCAWNASGIKGKIVTAIEINTVANKVYEFNFPKTCLLNKNIQSLTADEINGWDANVILMSPPCQPFTRNGNFLDTKDDRTESFLHILRVLKDLPEIQFILLENVKGFEKSSTRDDFINTLTNCNFNYQEFLLNPLDIGIPNSRLRYYCIARKDNFNFTRTKELMYVLPNVEIHEMVSIQHFLEPDDDSHCKYLVPRKHLKRAKLFDICLRTSKRSCCFTKAYTHFIEGTGSVICDNTPEVIQKVYQDASKYDPNSEEYKDEIQKLKLRFFTPKEVASLMSFPPSYHLPNCITTRQSYRLLGNSINIKIVCELIKLLVS